MEKKIDAHWEDSKLFFFLAYADNLMFANIPDRQTVFNIPTSFIEMDGDKFCLVLTTLSHRCSFPFLIFWIVMT